ncbi:SIR2 family protein [Spirosoma pulveris]
MYPYALLIGNGINNIVPNNSWADLLEDMVQFCKVGNLMNHQATKPFPLLYEEIFLRSLQVTRRREIDLKTFIARKVAQIEPNEIHERIREFGTDDIITTNYEFSLEGQLPLKNSGVIDEKVYSVFRHYEVNAKRYWHIHGDCRVPNSINLGFEHYGGQLQQMRNYVVSGTHYKSTALPKHPFIKRLKTRESMGLSWIDLFFTTDIYILGLSLDFVESDLWWLLTYRARQLYYRSRADINNKIVYFLPSEYVANAQNKLDFFAANGVQVIDTLSGVDKVQYYHQVLDYIERDTH